MCKQNILYGVGGDSRAAAFIILSATYVCHWALVISETK